MFTIEFLPREKKTGFGSSQPSPTIKKITKVRGLRKIPYLCAFLFSLLASYTSAAELYLVNIT